MEEQEIIQLWRQGLSKNTLAVMYKRRYNQNIKLIRAEMHNRHRGRFITEYQALGYVEKVIYRYLKRRYK